LFSKNTTASSINSIKIILHFKATAATAYYLGLPFIIGKSKKEAFQSILARVLGKIDTGVPKHDPKLEGQYSLKLLLLPSPHAQ
jgi:hypothetical protein